MYKLPSSNAIANLILKHGKDGTGFLRKIELYPTVNITLCHKNAENILQENQDNLFIDGTFQLIEEKLILNTMMTPVQRIGIPCVFNISDGIKCMRRRERKREI